MRLTAILQTLQITFLWATSWILVKFSLEDISHFGFARVRRFPAFLVVLIVYAGLSHLLVVTPNLILIFSTLGAALLVVCLLVESVPTICSRKASSYLGCLQ